MTSRRLIVEVPSLLLALLAAGCGVKGPLYVPNVPKGATWPYLQMTNASKPTPPLMSEPPNPTAIPQQNTLDLNALGTGEPAGPPFPIPEALPAPGAPTGEAVGKRVAPGAAGAQPSAAVSPEPSTTEAGAVSLMPAGPARIAPEPQP